MHTYENHGGEQRRNSIFQCVMCKACRLNGLNFRFEKFTLPGDSCSKVPWINSDLPFHEVDILNTIRYIGILWTRLKYIQCVFSVLHTCKINNNIFSNTHNQCVVLSPQMPLSWSYYTMIYDLTDFSLPWFAAVPWWVFILQPFGILWDGRNYPVLTVNIYII